MARKKPPVETPPDPKDPVLPAVNPVVEDHLTPAESLPFPIVAVGASAGGLEAFTELLGALPANTGMAFVMVQHLSPHHESMLSDILHRATSMPVQQVEDNMPVQPDRVYVIPPGKNLVYGNNLLQLAPRTEIRGQQRPIDHFMRSLAEEHGHKAIGVVLSGTANDGSLGIQEIKAAGGITFAQDSTAEQQSMPKSAIATGAVDFVLPPEEIARELARIATHPYVSPALDKGSVAVNDAALQRILGMLRHHVGVDFDGYKRSTIHRRIARRMLLHKLEGLQDYLALLQVNAAEVDALFNDLLINVTSFFRNPEAYEALKETVFPKLTDARPRHEQVRIWALGCSTGEEAYSLAMAFTEYAEASGRRTGAQIFATDLNGVGVEKARSGIYGKGIAQDVSPERLRRFFVEIDGSYRIAKPIRDMCVFARQNVLADPPFSRLDFVACRNMLIYLEPAMQQRLIPTLHYALRNEGFLWLGGSETIGAYRDLFELLDTRNKIYAKKSTTRRAPVPAALWDPRPAPATRKAPEPGERPAADAREVDRLLLSRYSPPAVVLDHQFEILQFRGDTSPFLGPVPGRASLNILKMLREGLMVAVRAALMHARKEERSTRESGLRVRTEGGWREVDVEVIPVRETGGETGFVVVFEEPAATLQARARQLHATAQAETESVGRQPGDPAHEKEVARLHQELDATREYLQSVIEQQEAANEELQSANEEVQSANEELQSINEEVETSKEEIQSANEELATVNDELQNRNLELSHSNNDLTNLLASVQLPIVMVGPDLRIRRFTPAAEKLFNLIPGDLGRPLGDIKLHLSTPNIEEIAAEVIQSVTLQELEVQDRNGHWYSLRVRPYRTLENRIEGAVIVLVDVDALKRGEQALGESEARFEVLANSSPVLIWMNDLHGTRFVNRAFEDFTGDQEPEICRKGVSGYVHHDEQRGFEDGYREAITARRVFESRNRFRRSDGAYRWMKTVATPRFHAQGRLVGYVGGTFDVTDLKEAEAALLELDRGKNEFLAMLAHELRNPLAGVRNASRLLDHASNEQVLSQARQIIDRQTIHMVRMIDDLLDVTRITMGKIHLRLETVDLIPLIRACVETTLHEREGLGQSLAVTMPEGPVWIRGDPMRLDQILANLLNNASKFTRRGGRIWLAVEQEPSRRGEPSRVTIRVRDNGVGIEAALLPRIFDLFVQADRPSDRTRSGIGLGLTLARHLVMLHEGTIEAFSAGNALGSEFVVRLPVAAPPPADAGKSSATGARSAASARRILIVDDNRDSAESMRLMFVVAGHEVEIVDDGESAESAALRFRPHAILLDIGLPDIDGYSVARRLRGHPEMNDVLIVAVTGYGRDQDIRSSASSGIDEHMVKPIDFDLLMDSVARGRASREAPAGG